MTVTDADTCSYTKTLILDDITDRSEENVLKAVKVFPNQTTSNIHVQSEVGIEIQDLTVVNLVGQEFQMQTPEPNAHSQQLDVSELPNGVYFLTVSTDQGEAVYRFVKA